MANAYRAIWYETWTFETTIVAKNAAEAQDLAEIVQANATDENGDLVPVTHGGRTYVVKMDQTADGEDNVRVELVSAGLKLVPGGK